MLFELLNNYLLKTYNDFFIKKKIYNPQYHLQII